MVMAVSWWRLEVWGGGYTDPDYVAASSCRTCNLPQIPLESVLRAHTESLNPGNVRFNHELIGLVQDEDGVLAAVRNKDDDTEFNVRAQYFAADGGRTVRKMLGVEMGGPRDLMRMGTVHFTADLSKWLKDDEVLRDCANRRGTVELLISSVA